MKFGCGTDLGVGDVDVGAVGGVARDEELGDAVNERAGGEGDGVAKDAAARG